MCAGLNAFSASASITIESLPPENSSAGRSNSAATSRMTWIDSASRTSSWDRRKSDRMLSFPDGTDVLDSTDVLDGTGLLHSTEQQSGDCRPTNQDIRQERILPVVDDRTAVDAGHVAAAGRGNRRRRGRVPLVEPARVQVHVVLASYYGSGLGA